MLFKSRQIFDVVFVECVCFVLFWFALLSFPRSGNLLPMCGMRPLILVFIRGHRIIGKTLVQGVFLQNFCSDATLRFKVFHDMQPRLRREWNECMRLGSISTVDQHFIWIACEIELAVVLSFAEPFPWDEYKNERIILIFNAYYFPYDKCQIDHGITHRINNANCIIHTRWNQNPHLIWTFDRGLFETSHIISIPLFVCSNSLSNWINSMHLSVSFFLKRIRISMYLKIYSYLGVLDGDRCAQQSSTKSTKRNKTKWFSHIVSGHINTF